MTSIIKRLINKVTEVQYEYMGNEDVDGVSYRVTHVRFHPRITEVQDSAFHNRCKLKEIVFNESLERIGESSFFNCESLKEVVLNEGYIGRAFMDCSSLRKVKLHERIQTMGRDAFCNCSSLESFAFPGISARLNNIIQAGKTGVEIKVDQVSGLYVERRGSELFVTAEVMSMGCYWKEIKRYLDRIVNWISYYEIKEATSLFELALWKARIDQAEEANEFNRDACRIEVPGPVKDTIIKYLR